jgi:hypothetical protein
VGGYAKNADNAITFAVSRFTAGGVVDGSFGTDGTRRFQPAPGVNPAFLTDVLVQPDGKVLLLGSIRADDNNNSELVLLRLQPEGDLDGSFGGTGVVRIRIGSTGAGRARLSPDAASVVVTGASTPPSSMTNGLVARILLAAPTTTTTLPAHCMPAPSVAGAGCRIAGIVDEVAAVVAEGKLQRRLLRVLRGAGDRVEAAEPLHGRPFRRALRKAAAGMRRAGRLLGSKGATRAIDDAERAALSATMTAVTSELDALVGA